MSFDSMSARDGERRLTPAARESLDELTAAYRARLIEQAIIESRGGKISAIDFMRSVYANSEADDSMRARMRFERELDLSYLRLGRARRATTVAIALIIAISAVVAMLSIVLLRASIVDIIPLLATPTVTVFALAIGRYYTIKEEHKNLISRMQDVEFLLRSSGHDGGANGGRDADVSHGEPGLEETNYRFMNQWTFLESQLEKLATRVLPDTGRRSIGTIIKQLTYDGTLTEYQADQIKRMLTVRNDLVHGGLPKNYALRNELNEIASVNSMVTGLLETVPPLSQSEKSGRTVKRVVAKWNDPNFNPDEHRDPQ